MEIQLIGMTTHTTLGHTTLNLATSTKAPHLHSTEAYCIHWEREKNLGFLWVKNKEITIYEKSSVFMSKMYLFLQEKDSVVTILSSSYIHEALHVGSTDPGETSWKSRSALSAWTTTCFTCCVSSLYSSVGNKNMLFVSNPNTKAWQCLRQSRCTTTREGTWPGKITIVALSFLWPLNERARNCRKCILCMFTNWWLYFS